MKICVICDDTFFSKGSRALYCAPCKRKLLVQKASSWYYKNKDRRREYDARRREEHRHLYREASKRFRRKNPERKNADTGSRRRRFREATPKWANMFFIKEIYELAILRTKMTGLEWHVDHIIPLRGKLVCGLHVENNLAVVPAKDNLRKSNHFSIEHNGRK